MADTTLFDRQVYAAKTLSPLLTQLGYNHVFIGGFALALLGSPRPTEDVDLLVEIRAEDVQPLRTKITEVDPQFRQAGGMQLVFLKSGEDPTHQILIETARANNMGLPLVAGPSVHVNDLPVLRPDILFLTKVKRWDGLFDNIKRARKEDFPPRPETLKKFASDKTDILWLIKYLGEHNTTVVFEDHKGKTKADLIKFVASFAKEESSSNPSILIGLWAILSAQDRAEVELKMKTV